MCAEEDDNMLNEAATMAANTLNFISAQKLSYPLLKCATVGFMAAAGKVATDTMIMQPDCEALYKRAGGLPDCVSSLDDLHCLIEFDSQRSVVPHKEHARPPFDYQMCDDVSELVIPFQADESEFALADQYVSYTLSIPDKFRLRCGNGNSCSIRRPFLFRSDGTLDVCPIISTEHNSKYQLQGFMFTEYPVDDDTLHKESVDKIVEINSFATDLTENGRALSANLAASDLHTKETKEHAFCGDRFFARYHSAPIDPDDVTPIDLLTPNDCAKLQRNAMDSFRERRDMETAEQDLLAGLYGFVTGADEENVGFERLVSDASDGTAFAELFAVFGQCLPTRRLLEAPASLGHLLRSNDALPPQEYAK